MTEAEIPTEQADPAVLDLIRRLETADRGCLSLSADIYEWLGYQVKRERSLNTNPQGYRRFGVSWRYLSLSRRPSWCSMSNFAGDMSSALDLAERVHPGCFPGIQKNRWAGQAWSAYLTPSEGGDETEAMANEPALALCAAVIRAKALPQQAAVLGSSLREEEG
jgi:hypothetical protein